MKTILKGLVFVAGGTVLVLIIFSALVTAPEWLPMLCGGNCFR